MTFVRCNRCEWWGHEDALALVMASPEDTVHQVEQCPRCGHSDALQDIALDNDCAIGGEGFCYSHKIKHDKK